MAFGGANRIPHTPIQYHGHTIPGNNTLSSISIGEGKIPRNIRQVAVCLLFIAGAPEVMVKVSSYSKTKTGLKMHVDYISRESMLPVYDNTGYEFDDIQEALGQGGKEKAIHARINAIADANTNTHEERRLSANIVLSMPPGVHEEGFRAGVKHFLADQYDGHG